MEAAMWIIPTGTSKNCGNGSNRGLSESQPRLSKSNKGIDSRKRMWYFARWEMNESPCSDSRMEVVRQEDKEVKPRQGSKINGSRF
ncbi:hypothetical protein HCDG_03636 [Histoplasma capsulatum H143]|uniref:Uncharacterized protein n=1 Tax=Ajellomyces capsulatus (strain H143) TaxID=544712 RepID=C6HC87_AJECH|nr:hypothetical protein HCDG_03636 [Histoplasma capsulatum H143]